MIGRRHLLEWLCAPPRWLLAAPFVTCVLGTVGVWLIDWWDRDCRCGCGQIWEGV